LVAGLFIVLLAGTTVSTWQAIRATRERDRAEDNFRLARAAADGFFTQVSDSPAMRAFGLENLRRDLLRQAKAFYERFIQQQPENASLQADLGDAYRRLGKIDSMLGETAAAEASYTHAVAILENLQRREPAHLDHTYRLAQAKRELGEMLAQTSRLEAAESILEQASALARALVQRDGRAPAYRHNLALAQHALGELWRHTNRLDRGRDAFLEAINLETELTSDQPDGSGQYRSTLATSAGKLAEAYRVGGQPARGIPYCLSATRNFESLVREFPKESVYQYNLANQYHGAASLYLDTGQLAKAREPLVRAAALGEQLVRAHPDVLDYVVLLAESYSRLARFENTSGHPDAVLEWTTKGIQTVQRVIDIEPRHSQARRVFNDLRIGRAVALAQRGDLAQAVEGADEVSREERLAPVDLYNVACVYSRCLEAVQSDASLASAPRSELERQYADRAMDTLRHAVAAGFQSVPALESEADFKPLRNRDDFRQLLQALATKAAR
jgi:tetratricopeptide (TPR) repeat protein